MKKNFIILATCGILCCTANAQTNTATGTGALSANTTGGRNAAFGNSSLGANTTGSENTAIGYNSMIGVTTNNIWNTAVGGFSLRTTNSGANTAIGYKSQEIVTGGGENASLGYRSLQVLQGGGQNVALGTKSMMNVTGGSSNTAVGFLSLGNGNGNHNTAIGYYALVGLTTGYDNVALGYESGASGTGIRNINIGAYTGGTNNTSYNIIMGYRTGATTGNNNIIIGKKITLPAGTSNAMNIGGVLFGSGFQSALPTVVTSAAANGKIGINVVSPTATLDVAGDAKISSNLTVNGNLNFATTSLVGIGTTNPQAKLEVDAEGDPTNTEDNPTNGISIKGTDQSLYMGVKSSSHVSYIQSVDYGTAVAPLLLNARGGNVGIGTTTPASNLDVTVPSSSSQINAMTINVTSFQNNTNRAASSYFKVGDLGDPSFTPFIIKGDGSVGIGTAHPAYPLDVYGTIRARQILVNLNGTADFVFKDDYKLKPIQEVYEFAKENKHLPEIPSEAEVVKNGMNMGEFQVKLLQKVEELTLYVAQQDKKIKDLETLINK